MYTAKIASRLGRRGQSRTISEKVKFMALAQILGKMEDAKIFSVVQWVRNTASEQKDLHDGTTAIKM